MNSAERILHYANEIEQEASSQRPENKPPPEWPQNGQIAIGNISLRYRPGLPLVLKNITINIKAGEKIGIIGRYVRLDAAVSLYSSDGTFVQYWFRQELAHVLHVPLGRVE
jgi:ABC-type transport system involved in Fe-S cluster assembly fused permease/ATPase subunit